MSKLDDEINDLLTALRLEPRKAWQDEILGPAVPGRCAGSYGCGTIPSSPRTEAEADSVPPANMLAELSALLKAGVSVEHAAVALARKHADTRNEHSLSELIRVLRDPNSTRESFADALVGVGRSSGDLDLNDVRKAIEAGHLDQL